MFLETGSKNYKTGKNTKRFELTDWNQKYKVNYRRLFKGAILYFGNSLDSSIAM
jgi:hypothetical protein